MMNALEDKAISRNLAKAGVPTPPAHGIVENEKDAPVVAKKIGYPVMIKSRCRRVRPRHARVAHNDISFAKGYHNRPH